MAVWEAQQLFSKEFEAARAALGSKYGTGLQIIFFSVSELVDFFVLGPAAALRTNAAWICNLLQRKVALSILHFEHLYSQFKCFSIIVTQPVFIARKPLEVAG